MKIWVDCDGVLANFCDAYLSILTEVTGRAHEWAHVTHFDFAKCIASEAEDELVWRTIDKRPGFVRSLRWVPGAHVGLAELRTLETFGAQVRCLTSPHIGPHWMHERAQWLLNRGFKKKEIVFCADKPLVHGDVLIEDNLETANAWQSAHRNGVAILLDAPYNRGETRGHRAKDWNEIVRIVSGLAVSRG